MIILIRATASYATRTHLSQKLWRIRRTLNTYARHKSRVRVLLIELMKSRATTNVAERREKF